MSKHSLSCDDTVNMYRRKAKAAFRFVITCIKQVKSVAFQMRMSLYVDWDKHVFMFGSKDPGVSLQVAGTFKMC